MRSLTILVDSREQKPLLFPKTLRIRGRAYAIEVKKQKLEEGDYALEGCSAAVIERKGSIRELFQNLVTEDKRRMKKALDRLCKATPNPVLLLEGGVGDLMKDREVPDCGAVLQLLMDECAERDIRLMFVGNCKYPTKRRQVGEMVIRLLAAYSRKYNGTR
jgi:ERCC4-type nuclease